MLKNPVITAICIMFMTGACWDTTYLGEKRVEGDTIFETDSESETNTSEETDVPTDKDSESGNDTASGTTTDSDTDSGTGTSPDQATETDTATQIELPDSFQWTSSGPLISPLGDGENIKDPTVVRYGDDSNGEWLIYATRQFANNGGINLAYLHFSDWADAASAEKVAVNTNPNMNSYIAAPQLFYFSPRDEWYLVYQHPEPAYSVSSDPTDVSSWTAPVAFMPVPPLLTDNGDTGYDYWIICDDSDCYLFFTGLNGILYRARTSRVDFPNGFEGSTQIVMQDKDNRFALYDACNVYRMEGTDKYLLLVSAIGPNQDDWRYSRAWTSDRLDGSWSPLADTINNSFASKYNSANSDWSTFGIVHGEILRWNPDETMTVDISSAQFLYSGLLRDSNTNIESYHLGLLSIVR